MYRPTPCVSSPLIFITTHSPLFCIQLLGPVSLSLIASFMSSVTILGVPAEYYIYGTMFSWYGVVYLYLPFIIVGLFIPVFYDLEITSTYEVSPSRWWIVAHELVY